MPKNSLKTAAIKVILGNFNIKREALMVIGDNYNDMDMIQYAGLGIAMGNSPDEVKYCADETSLFNDETVWHMQ
jgi:hydroxymethylpyrimidine pyrophosphatase-like HAD family hydrolase